MYKLKDNRFSNNLKLVKQQNNFDLNTIACLQDNINVDAFSTGSFNTSLGFQEIETPYFKNKVHIKTNPLAERNNVIKIKGNDLHQNKDLEYIYDNMFPELLPFKAQHNNDLDELYRDLDFLPAGNNYQDDLFFQKNLGGKTLKDIMMMKFREPNSKDGDYDLNNMFDNEDDNSVYDEEEAEVVHIPERVVDVRIYAQ